MATKSELVEELQRLGGFLKDRETLIIDMMYSAQTELESMEFLPWFLHTHNTIKDLDRQCERVELPGNFIRPSVGEQLVFVDKRPIRCVPSSVIRELRAKYSGQRGFPNRVALTSLYLEFFPAAEANYKIELDYYFRADNIKLVDKNLWTENAPEVLSAWTGEKLALSLRDQLLYNRMKEERIRTYDNLVNASTAREEGAQQYTLDDSSYLAPYHDNGISDIHSRS